MKKPFTITVEESIYNQIKTEADKEGRNLSNMIEYILRKYLEEKQLS